MQSRKFIFQNIPTHNCKHKRATGIHTDRYNARSEGKEPSPNHA